MYIVNIIFSNLKTESYSFDYLYDCIEYLDALVSHFGEFHPGENIIFSFCYKTMEDLDDVQS